MDLTFAPNGDPIVDGYESIFRLRASDGTTAWETPRANNAVGGYGVAVANGAVYALESSASGDEVTKLDLTTGAPLYASGSLSAFAGTSPPFFGNDGRLHVAFTSTGFAGPDGTLVTLRDTGTSFITEWSQPTAPLAGLRYGTCPDGSAVHFKRVGNAVQLQRLDAATGTPMATGGFEIIHSSSRYRITVDALGRVFFANGAPSVTGALTVFDENFSPLWQESVYGMNTSGAALGRDGTLVLAGSGLIKALRSPRTRTSPFCTGGPAVTACPCGSGYEGNGCPNSAHEGGARLAADGVASVANDTFTLRALDLPDGPCLFLQGTGMAVPGATFGDGALCVSGPLLRLGVEIASMSRARHPAPAGVPISVTGQIPGASPTTRTYQVWYRDAASFCAAQTFNLSNGLEAVWVP